MIAKAKVISHGANAIRYSVDKDKAEIVKTNLLPDDISPTAMWARMLALQKKFEDKLNRYHPLKRNMIRIEVSPTSEETQGWTIEDWQRLANDFIRAFDAVDLSAKSKRKSAKATNLKDSQYVVALHRDSKSGIMHLHIDANRIDMRGNVNDAHYIYERAMAAAAKVGQQRGWKDAQEVSRQNKEVITNDCLSVLAKMPYFDWGLYTKCLTQMGYDVKLQSDNKGQVRGYAIKRGNSIYKSSELGKGRCLMPSKIEGTWAKLHQSDNRQSQRPIQKQTSTSQGRPSLIQRTRTNMALEQRNNFIVERYTSPAPDRNRVSIEHKGKNFTRYIPNDIIRFFDDEFDYRKVGNRQPLTNLAMAYFTMLAVSDVVPSGGGGGSSSDQGWGRDRDEDEKDWARRCAQAATVKLGRKPKSGYRR